MTKLELFLTVIAAVFVVLSVMELCFLAVSVKRLHRAQEKIGRWLMSQKKETVSAKAAPSAQKEEEKQTLPQGDSAEEGVSLQVEGSSLPGEESAKIEECAAAQEAFSTSGQSAEAMQAQEDADPQEASAEEEPISAEREDAETSVVIAVKEGEKKSFAQRYEELTADIRRRYDSVLAYLLSQPDCRKIETRGCVTVKCRTDKLMRVMIRRGSVLLHFMIVNNELNRFVREEGVKGIKITPVVVRLDSDEEEDLARQTAEIAYEQIVEEQKYRRARANELRRQRRKEKEARAKAEAAQAAESAQGAEEENR